MRIFKYQFAVDDEITIEMPKGAAILCVQAQNEAPCIWAMVDPGEPKEDRDFALRGTGHGTGFGVDAEHYIGTFQLRGGALVFHLFERV